MGLVAVEDSAIKKGPAHEADSKHANSPTLVTSTVGRAMTLTKPKLHIRIAGVDAPELAHWGREAQPYSKEALELLTSLILNRRVRAQLYRRDQYDRIVAQVYVRKWFFKKDVGLEMLKAGLATVYEAKSGAEFGNSEEQYRAAEEQAKQRKVGMWSKPGLLQRLAGAKTTTPESPREYKTRHTAAEKQKST